jgi:hypothetical protein
MDEGQTETETICHKQKYEQCRLLGFDNMWIL